MCQCIRSIVISILIFENNHWYLFWILSCTCMTCMIQKTSLRWLYYLYVQHIMDKSMAPPTKRVSLLSLLQICCRNFLKLSILLFFKKKSAISYVKLMRHLDFTITTMHMKSPKAVHLSLLLFSNVILLTFIHFHVTLFQIPSTFVWSIILLNCI
mgnify:FL=1